MNIYTQSFVVAANTPYRLSTPVSRSINFFSIRDVNRNLASLLCRFSISNESAQNYAPIWEGQTIDVGETSNGFDYVEFNNLNSYDVYVTVTLSSGVIYDFVGQKEREKDIHNAGYLTVWDSGAPIALDLSTMVSGERATVISNCVSSVTPFSASVIDADLYTPLFVSRFSWRAEPFDRTKDGYLKLLMNDISVSTYPTWGYARYVAGQSWLSELQDYDYYSSFGGATPASICWAQGLNMNFFIRLYS
jgi:hypothetical protein